MTRATTQYVAIRGWPACCVSFTVSCELTLGAKTSSTLNSAAQPILSIQCVCEYGLTACDRCYDPVLDVCVVLRVLQPFHPHRYPDESGTASPHADTRCAPDSARPAGPRTPLESW